MTDVEGQRSDTLMVAHVEPSAQRTFVVSFPRDLMVNVPGTPGGQLSMINSAYSTGGPELVRDTLKANFDIDINHYLEVDFQSFKEIVNEIGNVRVYLPGRVRDLELGMLSPYGAGCYDVDGDTALVYVRSRKLQISDPDGDYVDPETGEHWRRSTSVPTSTASSASSSSSASSPASPSRGRWATRSSRCRSPTTCSATSRPTRR